MKLREISVWIARLIVGGLFTYAGVMKLLNPASFSSSLAGFGILPVGIISPLALGLPVVEIFFGIAVLAVPALRRAGTIGLVCLLLTFITVLSWATIAGKKMECSCFGSDSFLEFGGTVGALVRNLVMVTMVTYLLVHGYKSERLRS
ncbi:MauE/DoxX family redox-associated membrane protein [Roseimicrobium sp. ORNL1]|uniref:MauE/DoxX family redox-associated membrane protein n=1 Tax=Roseimicrobium sp. ORNL1 TaxID=2711231 RepID=UPI0013E1D4DB|nr:MauE/DoxX family redox-associated membrane protein [Roseimicrobium sp. ORNL1]QIF02453.1 DoxX family membrane protein [Roseimicrobium sp. ORNL1]